MFVNSFMIHPSQKNMDQFLHAGFPTPRVVFTSTDDEEAAHRVKNTIMSDMDVMRPLDYLMSQCETFDDLKNFVADLSFTEAYQYGLLVKMSRYWDGDASKDERATNNIFSLAMRFYAASLNMRREVLLQNTSRYCLESVDKVSIRDIDSYLSRVKIDDINARDVSTDESADELPVCDNKGETYTAEEVVSESYVKSVTDQSNTDQTSILSAIVSEVETNEETNEETNGETNDVHTDTNEDHEPDVSSLDIDNKFVTDTSMVDDDQSHGLSDSTSCINSNTVKHVTKTDSDQE